ncbi:MAG: hypothetical protein PHX79_07130 [Sphaerochaetaceae bacterium]|nr:hypothetical protein [Sphaerochaetaceae bacterium]
MTINDTIEAALSNITYGGKVLPATHLHYSGTEKTYLQYYTYLDQDEFSADDEPQEGNTYSTVDIYSNKRDALMELLPIIKSRLRTADFSIISAGPEIYENDSKMYHLPIDISYEREA